METSQEVMDEISADKRFKDKDISKAQIHAYLSWQENCGSPLGQAITTKYLEAENPATRTFVTWLNLLFIE